MIFRKFLQLKLGRSVMLELNNGERLYFKIESYRNEPQGFFILGFDEEGANREIDIMTIERIESNGGTKRIESV